MAIEIQQEQRGEVRVLGLVGRLDAESAADLQLQLQELLAAGTRHVVVDCSSLTYLSSAGVNVLLELAGQLRGDASLRLCGVVGGVRESLVQSQAADRFAIYRDRSKALADHPKARTDAALAAAAAQLMGVTAAETAARKKNATSDVAHAAAELLGARAREHKPVTPEAVAPPPDDTPGLVDRFKRIFRGK